MADEHVRPPSEQVASGPLRPESATQPVPSSERVIPHPRLSASSQEAYVAPGAGADPASIPRQAPHDYLLLLRWSVGVLIIICSGWGFIALVAFIAHRHGIGIPFEAATAIAALLSLGMFLLLERDLWLSRFMGLRLTAKASPLKESLFFWFFGIAALLLRSTAVATTAPGRPATSGETDSFREVVETIVFVVVLVLLLKSFLAEAFVIPTGSMATTLLGYHRHVTCPQCGYHFDVNASKEVDAQEGELQPVIGCTCPNCRVHINLTPRNVEGILPQ
jgi:hypothetical protein